MKSLSLNLTQLVQGATRVSDVDSHTANCLDLLSADNSSRPILSVDITFVSFRPASLVKSVSVNSPIPAGAEARFAQRAASP